MRIIARSFVALLLGVSACAVYGSVPQMTVSVSDSNGKAAYNGATDSKGVFATSKLQPGNYTVQVRSNSAPKGSHYSLVVSAGAKKVTASAIGAEKLAGGGVAMKIDVGAGLNITGQIAAEHGNSSAAPMGKNGQPMVWIPKKLGSNIPAHWAEANSAEAKEAMTSGSYSTKDIQNKQNQGISPGGN